MTSVFRTSDDIDIAYWVDDFTKPWRDAPVIVMLHSAMGHSGRFFAMVPPFLSRFRVVRMDLRGHGRSRVPPEDSPLTMERLVLDVAELLDHLEISDAHFLGNSAGGYISQNLAMSQPERVRSLLLFGSTPGLKHSNAATWLPRVARDGMKTFLAETIEQRFNVESTDPGLIEWFLDEAETNDISFIARFVGLMASLDWSDELHRIRCPTLVVIPGAEAVGGVENYRPMRERIPVVELVTFAGMAHNICDMVPDRCAAEALAFLARRFPSE